ncbi:MAG: hypothetical protein IPI32_01110 [Austwickia sp.]|jgi:hypothetical protein|nr:hypothetical protein [Austwickia sp.]MBK8437560.1 hypothetical protein [Austwickia sp.]MBK9102826.1 hypothetical protein [Austwickia sp.]
MTGALPPMAALLSLSLTLATPALAHRPSSAVPASEGIARAVDGVGSTSGWITSYQSATTTAVAASATAARRVAAGLAPAPRASGAGAAEVRTEDKAEDKTEKQAADRADNRDSGNAKDATTTQSTQRPQAAPSPAAAVACGSGSWTSAVKSTIASRFGISQIGGYRPGGGDHSAGLALDVMVGGDKAEGDRVAQWSQANAKALNVKYVIWYQRIWFPGRSNASWRHMSDRGGATANHYDHVHISFHPGRGTCS